MGTGRLLIVSLVLAGMSACICGAEETPTEKIQTEFEAGATLSESELRDAIRLAHRCGINPIAKVSTVRILPTPAFDIHVKSLERVAGRKVSFKWVRLYSERWTPSDSELPAVKLKREGSIWTRVGLAQTETLTTFTMNGMTVRINLGEKFPLAEADKIIAAFAAGRVRYKEVKFKEQLITTSFSEPLGLGGWKKGKFRISFRWGDACFHSLDCTLDGDTVVVLDVVTGCA